MKKFLCNFFVILYFIVAIMITVCLLSYNKYNITEIGNYSLVLSTDEELKDVANKGDLILVEKVKAKNLNVGDKVFFYSIEENETVISAAKIISKEENGWGGTSITVEGNYKLSAENIVGKVDGSKKVPCLGSVLEIMESRLVFLFLIVFPSFIAFIYELYRVVMEVKYGEFEDLE